MLLSLLFLWLAAWTGGAAVDEARVDAVQAVEHARAAFTLGTSVPSDKLFSRDALVKRVIRELKEELLLSKRFGMQVSAEMVAAELERIERQTEDPGQWAAMKHALQDDRRRIEEVICRPLLVRAFSVNASPSTIRSTPRRHAKARQARAYFIESRPVAGTQIVRLARANAPPPDARAWLAEAKARARGPRGRSSPERPQEPAGDRLVPLHPEPVRALESQLRRAGDVSAILSDQDRFAVYRLIKMTDEAWTVEAAVFPKPIGR